MFRLTPIKLNWNVPSIKIHVSPSRYRRIMEVLNSSFMVNKEAETKSDDDDDINQMEEIKNKGMAKVI